MYNLKGSFSQKPPGKIKGTKLDAAGVEFQDIEEANMH